MVRAEAAEVHYYWRDHDTDQVSQTPPVQNIWYEVFDAEDVRLLKCRIHQANDETVAKTVEVRWTIDGNVYLIGFALANNTWQFIFRTVPPSGGGTAGLYYTASEIVAVSQADKRGLTFKIEARMTAVPGTNQTFVCQAVRETHVQT